MPDPLHHSVFLNCAPEHAFDVFTARIDLWWPRSHRRFETSVLHLEPVKGGRFFERNTDGAENTMGEVLSCDPPHMIRYTWNPGKITEPTLVEVRFRGEGAGTQVEVTHSEGAAAMGDRWEDRAALFNAGWTRILAALDTFISENAGDAPDNSE